jgi:hypothetical protein
MYLYISDKVDSQFYIIKLQATLNHIMAVAGITHPWKTTVRSYVLLWECFSFVFMVYRLIKVLKSGINNNNSNNKVKFSNIFLVLPCWDD